MSSLVNVANLGILVLGGIAVAYFIGKPAVEATAKVVSGSITPSSTSEVVSSLVTPLTTGGQIATVVESVAEHGGTIVEKIGGQIPGAGVQLKKEQAAQQVGYKVPDYGDCISNANCLGKDSYCHGGKCIPYVARDNLAPYIKWNPEELGLKKYCGKYYLQGEGSKCDKDIQCSDIGVTGLAGIDSGKAAEISSRFYCSSNGRCETKGQNFLGTWYKREIDDPLVIPGTVTYNDSHKIDNRDKVVQIHHGMSEGCRQEFERDQPQDWVQLMRRVPV